jgi:hypothetical protein
VTGTPPAEAYEAAARAYCTLSFSYPAAAYILGQSGADEHLARDLRDAAEEDWLRAVVDAVWPLAVAATRRQVADEIRAQARAAAEEAGQFAPGDQERDRVVGARNAYLNAARIAEGTTHTEEGT